ncbi:MAG: patatin-like phospholipase family protein [Ignavibacteriae bacterium]|nr:patatin-like phospholipase family protein [Ignavibacteriota bacterium]
MGEFKILSIDGGGIRGVLPASYLAYIEEKLKDNDKIYEYFDMIVGTSTGAIIALALSLGISAKDILKLYEEKGSSIFPIRPRKLNFGLIVPKYSNLKLKEELKELLGEKTIINDCKTRVCIPTINITCGKIVVRKTRHHKDFEHDYLLPVWQVAAESSAAPGFFPAFEDGDKCQYIDGGLWANNPSLIGIAEALKLGYSLEQIKILSLGTGSNLIHKDGWKYKCLGLIGYGTSLVDITFQAQSQGVLNIAKYLLKDRFDRMDITLPKTSSYIFFSKFGIDKTGSVNSLKNFGKNEAKNSIISVKTKYFQNKVTAFQPVPN